MNKYQCLFNRYLINEYDDLKNNNQYLMNKYYYL